MRLLEEVSLITDNSSPYRSSLKLRATIGWKAWRVMDLPPRTVTTSPQRQ